jgi:apolipoprotein N-acyltransferase
MCEWSTSFQGRVVIGSFLMIFLSMGIIFPWCIFSQSDGNNIWAPIALTAVFGIIEMILGIYLVRIIVDGYEEHRSRYSLDGIFESENTILKI